MLRQLSLLALTAGLAWASASFCQHGGTKHCDCEFGWTGPECAVPVDFCNHTEIIRDGKVVGIHVCGDHGTCANTLQGANCTCDPGWKGPFCQENPDGCAPTNPCQSGGTCVDRVDGPGYTCVCPTWRTGPNCTQYVDVCDNLVIFNSTNHLVHVPPCGDHGTCVPTKAGFRCDCASGWNGTFCENRIRSSCEHGNATHPHGSVWRERCNTCQCHFGVALCEKASWCPARCLVYRTALSDVEAPGIPVGCATPRENCVPENVGCARENDASECRVALGWCFPMGYVMLDTPTPNPLPTFHPEP